MSVLPLSRPLLKYFEHRVKRALNLAGPSFLTPTQLYVSKLVGKLRLIFTLLFKAISYIMRTHAVNLQQIRIKIVARTPKKLEFVGTVIWGFIPKRGAT